MTDNEIEQVYQKLKIAGERIGENNYRTQVTKWKKTHKSMKNFKFIVTDAHRDVVDAMEKVLNKKMTCDDAMGLLFEYDNQKQRFAYGNRVISEDPEYV